MTTGHFQGTEKGPQSERERERESARETTLASFIFWNFFFSKTKKKRNRRKKEKKNIGNMIRFVICSFSVRISKY